MKNYGTYISSRKLKFCLHLATYVTCIGLNFQLSIKSFVINALWSFWDRILSYEIQLLRPWPSCTIIIIDRARYCSLTSANLTQSIIIKAKLRGRIVCGPVDLVPIKTQARVWGSWNLRSFVLYSITRALIKNCTCLTERPPKAHSCRKCSPQIPFFSHGPTSQIAPF